MTDYIIIILLALAVIIGILNFVKISSLKKDIAKNVQSSMAEPMDSMVRAVREDIASSQRETVGYINNSMKNYADVMTRNQTAIGNMQKEQLSAINRQLFEFMSESSER